MIWGGNGLKKSVWVLSDKGLEKCDYGVLEPNVIFIAVLPFASLERQQEITHGYDSYNRQD